MVRIAKEIMQQRTWDQFDATNEGDFAYSVPELGRFRVNAYRQRGSIGMVFRRVRSQRASFRAEPARRRPSLADEQRGLILVTGPTGCGKTTTLAAMVDHINRTRECHIVTIEDPIEVLHRDELSTVSQREVGFDTSSFLDRPALGTSRGPRRDPRRRDARHRDRRDGPYAAETGHLVFATLHTIDSVETVNRIVDFFPANQQRQARISLAGALKGTICQRLVPDADGSGRVPALEIMIVNGRIQQCIIDPDKTGDIRQIIREGEYYGMQTFDQALVASSSRVHRPACGDAWRPPTRTTCVSRSPKAWPRRHGHALLNRSSQARPDMDERGTEQRRDHRSGGQEGAERYLGATLHLSHGQ